MATFVPAKRATEYITYVSLVSQANTKIMQGTPTIATGDFKVSKDGGALANLTTLPAVTPASSKMVKITLSVAEMTADNVTVVCSDAAGDEWCDLVFNIQTVANQVDDIPTAIEVADAILQRDIDNVEVAAPVHSLAVAVLGAVSRVRDNAGTLEVYRTDGTTVKLSRTVTTDAALLPVDELGVGS